MVKYLGNTVEYFNILGHLMQVDLNLFWVVDVYTANGPGEGTNLSFLTQEINYGEVVV